MNKVTLIGRLTRDPDIRYSQAAEPLCIARYTLAVDRRFKKDQDQSADFISCVAFGRQGEFAEKYLHQGMKIAVNGRIQTGSYTNKEGQKVYTTEVVIEDHEFVESKAASEASRGSSQGSPTFQGGSSSGGESAPDGFMNIPEGIEEELPFS